VKDGGSVHELPLVVQRWSGSLAEIRDMSQRAVQGMLGGSAVAAEH
jgi:hypothetical protein